MYDDSKRRTNAERAVCKLPWITSKKRGCHMRQRFLELNPLLSTIYLDTGSVRETTRRVEAMCGV